MSLPEQTSFPSAGMHDNVGYRPSSAPSYAHWGKRVGAAVVDALTQVPFYALVVIVALATHSSHTATIGTSADGTPATVEVSDGISGTGWALIGCIYLALLAFGVWNLVFRQGRTGRSIGKSVLGIKLVRESTGEVAGAGLTFGRQICHVVDSFFLLGYLWPLWDDKRQTFADKICSTVVLDHKD
jgi:uncharacterized RDD family membrane protein YckC